MPYIKIEVDDLTDETKESCMEDLYNQIKESNKEYEYLEWVREPAKKGKKEVKVSAYH